jgi:hypothetical protein
MGPFGIFLGLLLLSTYRDICSDEVLGLSKTVTLFNGAVSIACSAKTYKVRSAGLLEDYANYYLMYEPDVDALQPTLQVVTNETATRFVYDGARLYTLDKVTVSTSASSTKPFMVEKPELAAPIQYEMGYLVAPQSFTCLGLNPALPSVLTSDTAKGQPTLYLGECMTNQQKATEAASTLINGSQAAQTPAQETIYKLQQWVLEPDLHFRTLKVTVNETSFNPFIPIRLTDGYDGPLHPARLVSEILMEEAYGSMGKNDTKSHKRELPSFLGARIAFYDELVAAGIEKESLKNLMDHYERSHVFPAFASDAISNYRDVFKKVMNNDFCRHLDHFGPAELFFNETSDNIQVIATPYEARDIMGCFMQDFSVVLTNPKSMIAHISNPDPMSTLGIRTLGYQLEEILLARIPERSKETVRKGMNLDKALFSQLQHTTSHRNQTELGHNKSYHHQNDTTKLRSPLLNYTTVLVTDSTNATLLNLSETVKVIRPLGDSIFGDLYIYFGNLKPNSFYRAVAVFSDLSNPSNLTRVYVDFETTNYTQFNVTSEFVAPKNQKLVCYPQLALKNSPGRPFACGNLETFFSNYPRFSATKQEEVDHLMTEYVRSCCFFVPENDKTSSTPCNSSLGTNLMILSTNPRESIQLLKEARKGILTDHQKQHLEMLHDYVATLDEKSVSDYLLSKGEISLFPDLQDRVARLYNKHAYYGQIYFRSPNVVDAFEDQLKDTFVSKRHVYIHTYPEYDYVVEIGHCEFYPRKNHHLTSVDDLDSYPAFFNASSFVYTASRPTRNVMRFDIEMTPYRFAECDKPSPAKNATTSASSRYEFPKTSSAKDSLKLDVIHHGHLTHQYEFVCENVRSLSLSYIPGTVTVHPATNNTTNTTLVITLSSGLMHPLEYATELNPVNITLLANQTQPKCLIRDHVPRQCDQVFTFDVSQLLADASVNNTILHFRDPKVPSMCEAINVYVPIDLAFFRNASKLDIDQKKTAERKHGGRAAGRFHRPAPLTKRQDWSEECPENDPVQCSLLSHNHNLYERISMAKVLPRRGLNPPQSKSPNHPSKHLTDQRRTAL